MELLPLLQEYGFEGSLSVGMVISIILIRKTLLDLTAIVTKLEQKMEENDTADHKRNERLAIIEKEIEVLKEYKQGSENDRQKTMPLLAQLDQSVRDVKKDVDELKADIKVLLRK